MTGRCATSFAARLSGRWVVLAIAMVCLVPLIAAMYFRFVSPPGRATLGGRPLEPVAFLYEAVQQMDGQPMSHLAVSDHWMIVHFESGSCASACRDALYLTRQARTAQGRHMDRIQRIWIISDGSAPTNGLLAANPDLMLLQVRDDRVAQQFGRLSPSMAPAIYLVDRRGFIVFRYEATVDPGVFIRELRRLVLF